MGSEGKGRPDLPTWAPFPNTLCDHEYVFAVASLTHGTKGDYEP